MPKYRKNDSLIEARKKAGFETYWEAAEAIGTSVTSYSGYENGRLYPSKEIQEKICDFYRSRGIFLFEDDVFPEEIKGVAKEQYVPKKGRSPPLEPIYLPPSEIRYLSDHNHVEIPVDYPIETEVLGRELSERSGEVLASLPKREEKVLRMRLGMTEKYDHDYTLEETGNCFSVSKERIRGIEARALRRIRDSSSNIRKLRAFLDRE